MDLFDFTFCNTLISINNSLSSEWILYMISTGVDPNLENSGTAVWAGTREAAFMANVKSTFRWFLQKTTLSLVKRSLHTGLVVPRHAVYGQIYRKMVVEGPLVITSIGETLLQTRPDQEKGIIGPASPLHS